MRVSGGMPTTTPVRGRVPLAAVAAPSAAAMPACAMLLSHGRDSRDPTYGANKPAPSAAGMRVPSNWNFNVSHEGAFVVLAAEPLAVVGVDVAAPFEDRPGKVPTMEENLRVFKDQLTAKEMKEVMKHEPDEVKMEQQLRTYWSLKESYTKARGDGIAFEFKRIEFTLIELNADRAHAKLYERATVAVDGTPLPAWRFDIQPLRAGHWVSVARGPPLDAIDAWGGFLGTFTAPRPAAALVEEQMQRREPRLEPRTVADLLPADMRDAHRAAAEQTGP